MDTQRNEILDILCGPEEDPHWLIPNLFLQGALICLAGEAGAGKSYVSYTMGLAIASGLSTFSGLIPASSEPKRVLYFDEENSLQDRNKYLRRSWFGLMKQNKVKDDSTYLERLDENFWVCSFHLGTEGWQDAARYAIEQVQPHVIIFDTATPAFNIEDENSNSEATQAVKDVRILMKLCDPVCTAIILKHAKMRTEKGGRRSMRGAKAWQGAADGVMFQVAATGRPRRDGLKLTRLEPDKTRAFGLRQTIYISPSWTDEDRNGLLLEASYSATKEHKHAEAKEEGELD